MIIGGQAVLLHGEPRLTGDIDVTVGADVDRLDDVLAAAKDMGLRPLVDPREFTVRTLVLPCQDPGSGIRVDFIFSFSSYERQAIERAVRVRIGQSEVRFATPEDLVIHKLLAGRPRDLEDVRSVLLKRRPFDADQARAALAGFGEALGRGEELLDRFEALWRDTRPPES
jgi:hypothetical protein